MPQNALVDPAVTPSFCPAAHWRGLSRIERQRLLEWSGCDSDRANACSVVENLDLFKPARRESLTAVILADTGRQAGRGAE